MTPSGSRSGKSTGSPSYVENAEATAESLRHNCRGHNRGKGEELDALVCLGSARQNGGLRCDARTLRELQPRYVCADEYRIRVATHGAAPLLKVRGACLCNSVLATARRRRGNHERGQAYPIDPCTCFTVSILQPFSFSHLSLLDCISLLHRFLQCAHDDRSSQNSRIPRSLGACIAVQRH